MTDIKNLREAMDEMFDFICDLPSGTDGFECDFDAAFGELKKVESALRWIPVTERLPELECNVYSVDALFYVRNEGIYAGYVNHETGTWKCRCLAVKFTKGKVTHWMPLPEPPKEVD